MSKRNRKFANSSKTAAAAKSAHPLDAPEVAEPTTVLPVVQAGGSATSSTISTSASKSAPKRPAHMSVDEGASKEALTKSLVDANAIIDQLRDEKEAMEKDLRKVVQQKLESDDAIRKTEEAEKRTREEAKKAKEEQVKAEEKLKLVELNLASKVEELGGLKENYQDISNQLKTAQDTIAMKNEEVRRLKVRNGELEKQKKELLQQKTEAQQAKEEVERRAKETAAKKLNKFQEAGLKDADEAFSRVLRNYSEKQEEKVLRALRQFLDSADNMSEENIQDLVKAAFSMKTIHSEVEKNTRKEQRRQRRFEMFG